MSRCASVSMPPARRLRGSHGSKLQVLRGFDANARAIIEGVAGSGKTLLAIQRARSLAKTHQAVLFTCFNAELAKWIREEMADDLVENGGKITAQNFHRLASDLCKQAELDFTVNQQDAALLVG